MLEALRIFFYQPLYNLFIVIVNFIPGHNVSVAIVVLTVLSRLALIPMKRKGLESQLKQRELQPEIKRIQTEHKNDRQAQNLAMMELFRNKGVHPASGCLPIIAQSVVLIALYSVFRHGVEQYDQLYSFVAPPQSYDVTFLWLRDITAPDNLFILPVAAGLSMFLLSRSYLATMPTSTNSNDMASVMSKQMMYMTPVLTVFFARQFAAALSLYWVVGSLIDWYQQVSVARKLTTGPKGGKVTVQVRAKRKGAV